MKTRIPLPLEFPLYERILSKLSLISFKYSVCDLSSISIGFELPSPDDRNSVSNMFRIAVISEV